MDLKKIHDEQALLAQDPGLLDALAERIKERPEPVGDYLRALAHSVIYAADEYLRALTALEADPDAEAIETIRETGSTLSVDLTIRLRSLHRAQEDPESKHYLTELTPAEKLLGRLSQSFVLLVGLGYREEVPSLLMTAHELRQMMGEPRVAQWLVDHTDENPWTQQAVVAEHQHTEPQPIEEVVVESTTDADVVYGDRSATVAPALDDEQPVVESAGGDDRP